MAEEIPPCNIMIDKEGKWYYKGAPMIRKDICLFFYEHLVRDSKGRYLLHIGDEKCYLEVEDTPFVVIRVDVGVDFTILLNDRTQEVLRLGTLWIGKDNVLYCKVKDNNYDARFNRPSYYQFANYITYDEERDKCFIPFDGNRYYLEQQDG